jgi:hypothetical protein
MPSLLHDVRNQNRSGLIHRRDSQEQLGPYLLLAILFRFSIDDSVIGPHLVFATWKQQRVLSLLQSLFLQPLSSLFITGPVEQWHDFLDAQIVVVLEPLCFFL